MGYRGGPPEDFRMNLEGSLSVTARHAAPGTPVRGPHLKRPSEPWGRFSRLEALPFIGTEAMGKGL